MKRKLAILGILFFFLLKSASFFDPDFGWHLKMGELILSSGFPKEDPFSYTMSSFHFVDHEWFTNVSLYLLNQSIGRIGLVLIFGAIALSSILVMLIHRKSYTILPLVLSAGALFTLVGIRPQLITWLFFSILITFFLNSKAYIKFRFFLPLFFLIWANLHGGFAIGIFIFALFLVVKIFENKKLDKLDLIVFLLSFFSTIVNPYGIGLWREIHMQMSDSSLRWSISEWMPAIFTFNIPMWILFVLSLALFMRFRKFFTLFEKILYLGLLVAGLSSIRHMAFWILFSMPILSKSLEVFRKEVGKIKYGGKRFEKSYIFLIILVVFFSLVSIMPLFINRSVSEADFYPKNAIGYLKANPTSGNLFSEYGWGGYLILNYPEKKVFIDGRMPSWRWSADIKNESNYAFIDYKNILIGKTKINIATKKYNIDTFLLPVPARVSAQDRLSQKLMGKISNEKKYDDVYVQLRKQHWEVVYRDNIAIIYRR